MDSTEARTMKGESARGAVVALATLAIVYPALSVAGFIYNESAGVGDWPLKQDQIGYYAYLPALLTESRWTFEDFVGPRWERFEASGFAGFPRNEETGRRQNVYPPGVAVLQAPFFALGHVAAFVTRAPRDGLSWPYRLFACLGGAAYAVLGLGLVFVTLRRDSPEWAGAATVVALGLGTNLLYYGTIEPLMSHAYSFFAFAAAVWAMLAWSESGRARDALTLGAALGLVVLIRPTNAVLALLPLLFLFMRPRDAGLRWGDTRDRSRIVGQVLAACGMGFIVTLPLLLYWRFTSGSWIHNPHGAGTFFFSEPAIGSVLWSYRKGWLVYTPIMGAAVAGLFVVGRYVRGITLPLAVLAAVNLYVVSSWWNWWYGGGFGMRALIESGAPLALPMASLAATLGTTARRRRRVWGVISVLAALNVFQTYQYVMNYIRWDGMTRETYWAVFLRPYIPEAEMAAIREDLDLEQPRSPRE
jgi:hypothetical protein